jgi:Ca-activated chloride channel homolog
MKYVIICLLLFTPLEKLSKVSNRNEAINAAHTAYYERDFIQAILKYEYVLDTLKYQEPRTAMNLALCFRNSGDQSRALEWYTKAAAWSSNAKERSLAYLQMGVMHAMLGEDEKAKDLLFMALEQDPTNAKARLNYEILLKTIGTRPQNKKETTRKGHVKEDPNGTDEVHKNIAGHGGGAHDPANQGKSAKERQGKDLSKTSNKKKEKGLGQNSKEPGDQKGNLEKDKISGVSPDMSNTGISEEKAKMILESMRHEEVQYMQQIKRKANNPDYKGKPNW